MRRKVVVAFSDALGDTIAWMPYIEQYRETTGYDVTIHTKLGFLFTKSYPKLHFSDNVKVKKTGIYFNIGWGLDDRHKTMPLQEVACKAFNIPYKEIRPKVDIPKKLRKRKKKYVCIATHSTSQSKYWNNPNGWQTVVDYLNDKGYDVIDIDRYKDYLYNTIPKNVIDKTGDIKLKERIKDIAGAEMFIGLGSGLSWLAWAIGTPVIMISGFSAPYTEFDCHRIDAPKDKCKHCFNKFNFDKEDLVWCPSDKKKELFECTKYIQPEDVVKAIEDITH
jgi:autotransporter strand-loop-strand O-heptosyltransferase